MPYVRGIFAHMLAQDRRGHLSLREVAVAAVATRCFMMPLWLPPPRGMFEKLFFILLLLARLFLVQQPFNFKKHKVA